MTYTDAVKSGFRLINRNWQLIAVQAAMIIVNCIGLFVIVVIPLGIAFVIFGLDLTGIMRTSDFFSMVTHPYDFITKYVWLVLIVLVCVLFYFLLKMTLKLYIFGGSTGIVGRGVLESAMGFSMKRFFSEAKQLFFPLLWYFSIASLIYLVIALVFILFGIGMAVVVTAAKSQDSTLALFLGIFFSIVFTLVAVSIVLAVLVVTVYGVAVLFFKREGSVKALKDAARFLWERQNVFWFSILLLFGYVLVSFVLIIVAYPFFLIPVIGMLLSFPLELVLYFLWLVVLAIIFTYYHDLEIKKEPPAPVSTSPETGPATGESSSGPEDISDAGVLQKEETPFEKGPTEEI